MTSPSDGEPAGHPAQTLVARFVDRAIGIWVVVNHPDKTIDPRHIFDIFREPIESDRPRLIFPHWNAHVIFAHLCGWPSNLIVVGHHSKV